MLDSGEIDALIGATVPVCFGRNPDVVRLFPDFRAMDEQFFARTRVHPIMHVVAMRKAILRDNPWIARNLFNAFEDARRRSLGRLARSGHFALPWHAEHASAMRTMFGGDYFPYGVEANRAALTMFLQYAHEQGIAHHRVQPEDIFPAGISVSAHV
jgi:4,5-dihydroxyphthalate decarboxylase